MSVVSIIIQIVIIIRATVQTVMFINLIMIITVVDISIFVK